MFKVLLTRPNRIEYNKNNGRRLRYLMFMGDIMGYVDFYKKISAPFVKSRPLMLILKIIYKILPIIVFISYPLILGYLVFTHDTRLFRCISVPLGVFLSLSVFRALLNAQRPYEKYGTKPLFSKETKGKSFPSRHTASAAVIGMAALYVNTILGSVFLAVSVLIALSRIIGGVHFPKDVAAGFLYAVVMGVIFFYLL